MSTPALDFCQRVRTWQDADGAASGLPVLMPGSALPDLDALLAEAQVSGPSPLLEDRARRWLIGYREITAQQGGLTPAQSAELDAIVTCIPLWDARKQPAAPSWRGAPPQTRRRIILAVVAVILAGTAAGLSFSSLVLNAGIGSPPPAGPVAAAPAGPRAGPLTDLQRFRADWDVPDSATADAGNPHALVLLQDGLYYPVLWSIPAGDPGWVPGTAGSVTASVHGGDADVTDSDGTTWTVSTGQPFVLASNPQAVFRVLRDATVQSMPQPHAIRVRTRL